MTSWFGPILNQCIYRGILHANFILEPISYFSCWQYSLPIDRIELICTQINIFISKILETDYIFFFSICKKKTVCYCNILIQTSYCLLLDSLVVPVWLNINSNKIILFGRTIVLLYWLSLWLPVLHCHLLCTSQEDQEKTNSNGIWYLSSV